MTTPRPLSFDLLEPVDTTALIPLAEQITNIIQEWPSVSENDPVDIKLQLSIAEYVMLATAIDVGRDIAFAEDSELVWWTWLKVFKGFCVACEQGDCIAYPSSANIITYSPQNPFSETDLVPDGYLTPPFTLFKNFPLLGWLSTYFPEFTESLTGYQPNDVIVDISSIPSGSWTEPALGMPQIAINVSGNGIIELHMLNFPLGGRAIVTIDTQPNVGDILGGILGNAEFSVELNRDILSIPPETVSEVIFELKIEDEIPTTHTIYITFVPTVDDALIPINFGGGLRSIVLCGLDEEIMPIVEDVRLNNCVLEVMINGQWVVKESVNDCITAITNPMQAQINTNIANIANNANNIMLNANAITNLQNADVNLQSQITANTNAIDSIVNVDLPQINTAVGNLDSRVDTIEANIAQNNGILSDHEQRIVVLENAGPGGAATTIKTTSYNYWLETQFSTLSSAFVEAIQVPHVFTYPNAMILVEVLARSNAASGIAEMRIRIDNDVPQDIVIGDKLANTFGTDPVSTEIMQVFEGLQIVGQQVNINVDLRAETAGTAFISGQRWINIGIIEYSSAASQIFGSVTFDDAGDLAWQSGTGNVGAVVSGGNPDLCLKSAPVAAGAYLSIEIDLGSSQTITAVHLDIFSSDVAVTKWHLEVGATTHVDENIPSIAANTWSTQTIVSGATITTQTFRVRLENADINSIADLRLDNIVVETQ